MTRPLGSTPTAPSRGFTATTGRSASTPRDGTHCLHGFSRSATPSRHPRQQCQGVPSHVPCTKPQTGLTSPTCRTPPGQKSGHPPDSSRADLLHPGFDVTLLSNDTSTAIPENEDCAPSSRSPPDASRAPFPHRSPRRSSANAACGGLQPPSARAAAKGHTFISRTAPCQEALPTNRTPFHVRGTRSFSNLLSARDALNCTDTVRLTGCQVRVVSPSCPIFGRASGTQWCEHPQLPLMSRASPTDHSKPDSLGVNLLAPHLADAESPAIERALGVLRGTD